MSNLNPVQAAQLSSPVTAAQVSLATEAFQQFRKACQAGDMYAARTAALRLAELSGSGILADV